MKNRLKSEKVKPMPPMRDVTKEFEIQKKAQREGIAIIYEQQISFLRDQLILYRVANYMLLGAIVAAMIWFIARN